MEGNKQLLLIRLKNNTIDKTNILCKLKYYLYNLSI